MNISEVFSTHERVTILRHIIYQTEPIRVSWVSRQTGTSKGLVSKYLNSLISAGIVEKENSHFLVVDGLQTRVAKIFLNLATISPNVFTKYPDVMAVGIYGSTVKGTNTLDSDLDLWVYHSDTSPEVLASITRDLKDYGDVSPLYLDDDKIATLKRDDPVFYYSLVFGSIMLLGESLESI